MKKQVLSFITLVGVLVCNTNITTEAADLDTFEFRVLAEENAQEQFDILMNSFVNDTFYHTDTMQIQTENITATISESKIEYPDNYAGAYYDSDNKRLNIILTDDNSDIYEDVLSSKGIVYSKADYSLKELYDNMDILSDVMDDYGFNSISLYQRSNSLHVTYDSEYTEKQLLEIIKNIGVPNNMVTVEKNSEAVAEPTAQKTPDKVPASSEINLWHDTKKWRATVGFNAYQHTTGKYGIVTAGHFISSSSVPQSTTITYEDFVINTKGVSTISNNSVSECDCAFIPFFSMTYWNKCRDLSMPGKFGYIKNYTYPAYQLENRTIYKYGINNKKEYAGTLECVSCTVDTTPDEMGNPAGQKKDMLKCKVTNYGGDSGGPIGFLSGSNSPYTLSIIGITMGGGDPIDPYAEFKTYQTTYATKITNVFSALKITLV